MPGPTLKIDLHIHTCASKDAALHPATVIEAAKRRGLDRICITDHNSIEGALVGREIDPDFVIVGEEILTEHGEILAFFVSEWVPPGLSHRETIDRLKDQGAVISVSHPFDRHRNQPWTGDMLAAIADQVDAIETFNARAIHAEDNRKAQEFAAAFNLAGTAGSDAHSAMEIGAAYLELPAFTTAVGFRSALPQAIIHGQLSPAWVHALSRLNYWRHRLGFKPRLNTTGQQVTGN